VETGNLNRNFSRKQMPKCRNAEMPHMLRLLLNDIAALDTTIYVIIIRNTYSGIFYAKIIFNNRGTVRYLDARPNNTIAHVLFNQLPIVAKQTLMRKLS
jgi:bifunctional DNase/RNase